VPAVGVPVQSTGGVQEKVVPETGAVTGGENEIVAVFFQPEVVGFQYVVVFLLLKSVETLPPNPT